MSWRIVSVSGVSKLDYKMDYLVVRNQEGIKRVHLSEIAILILESTAISLTAYLLCELNRHKVQVIFCDEKRSPYGLLMPLHGSHDTSLKYRNQIAWNEETKNLLWAEIVRSKIHGQAAVLPEEKSDAKQDLLAFAEQILPADPTNREGHAAKVYFNALFGMSFSRSMESPVNAALDYGYGVLLSAVSREIAISGYCTQLGIFHNNMFNPFNLASDLMEPFRPFMDAQVKALLPTKLEHDEKVAMVQVLNRRVRIDGKNQYLLNALRIYVKSVFDALEQRDLSLLRFPGYELQIYESDHLL